MYKFDREINLSAYRVLIVSANLLFTVHVYLCLHRDSMNGLYT